MKQDFKFSEIEYVCPDFKEVEIRLKDFEDRIKKASTYQEYKGHILEFDEYIQNVDLQVTLPFIRMYLDCTDEYYQGEMAKVQEGAILLDQTGINNAILESPFSEQLREEFGPELLAILHKDNKIYGQGKELQVKVEALVNQYQQLKASMQIEFEGNVYSEAELNKLGENPNRDIRKNSKTAYYKALLEKKDTWEDILNQLVEVRLELAKANGYHSYLDYMNEEKGRRGYGEAELNAFSAQVKQEIVPVVRKLLEAQAKRIGVDKINVFDQVMIFPDGNEVHVGEEGILQAAKKMYHGLSKDAGEFFDMMMKHELIEAKSSPNKIANMGFCTLLLPLKVPFIFGNNNNTPYDVIVFTHEGGHAYQGYVAMKKQKISQYYNEVNDIAEIPSKTMEQFSYEYAEEFFGDTKDKYLFHHQQQVLDELCAYCAVNEFENYLYTYPEATMEERIQTFNRIFREYAQLEEEDELQEYIDAGCLLYRNMGIYMFPKYLISYALSAISACEFRTKMDKDKDEAWADYVKLCEAGGSLSYRELLQLANLSVPFEEGAVKRCTESVRNFINKNL